MRKKDVVGDCFKDFSEVQMNYISVPSPCSLTLSLHHQSCFWQKGGEEVCFVRLCSGFFWDRGPLCGTELPTVVKQQQAIETTGIASQNLAGGLKTWGKFVLLELPVSSEVKTPVSSLLDTQLKLQPIF